jgi:hypothetical protein
MDPAPCVCGSTRAKEQRQSFGRSRRHYKVACPDCGRQGPAEYGRLASISAWNRSVKAYRKEA